MQPGLPAFFSCGREIGENSEDRRDLLHACDQVHSVNYADHGHINW
jgi:hypothetical protein